MREFCRKGNGTMNNFVVRTREIYGNWERVHRCVSQLWALK